MPNPWADEDGVDALSDNFDSVDVWFDRAWDAAIKGDFDESLRVLGVVEDRIAEIRTEVERRRSAPPAN